MANPNRSRLVAGAVGAVLVVATASVVIVLATRAPAEDDSPREPARPIATPKISVTLPEPPPPAPPSTTPDKPDPAKPRNAGILGATGSGPFAVADDDSYGGLIGTPRGSSGLGLRRPSSSSRKIKIGHIHVAPDAATPGELDKAIVRRYVKRRAAQLLYCYEKELLVKSNLSGTVTAHFTIRANGHTDAATAVGVDPAVASCVATVLGGIEFPRPARDGAVTVDAAFTFSPV